MALFAELRRRNVLKVALLYVIAAWLILWMLKHTAGGEWLPPWAETFALLVLIIGLPVALIFAWTYEITPMGLKRAADVDQTQSIVYKTGQKLNAAVAVLLVLGLLALIGEGLMPKFEFLVPGVPKGVPPALEATPPEIRSLTLDNGLKVIVWPDHDIPNVALYTFVRAGSRNEYPGITGLAHFFEHMMFLGTTSLEPGEFDRIMAAAGASNNARTSSDITVYQDWLPRSALETIFALEGDRFENLAIVPEALESERKVVLSERRSGIDDDNDGTLFEQVVATAYLAHPYQFPVIGWPADIDAWTLEDLESFYRTFYAPNNRTMIVVGDVTPGEVFELAGEYLGAAAAQRPPPAVRTVEPEQLGVRRVVVERPAQTPLLHLAFHAVAADDPQALGLELLMTILAGGDSSRLHRELVEGAGLALAVGGWADVGFDPGLAYFHLTLPPDGDPGEVEERLVAALARIAAEGVSDAELAKARNTALADYWRDLSTIAGKAESLGNHETLLGDYETLFALPGRLDAVSAADLEAIAADVFRPVNMTVGLLLPAAPEAAR